MFHCPFDESIVKRAINEKILDLHIHNLRDWAVDKHGSIDDKPYGGGKGMLLRPEPIFDSVKEIQDLRFKNYESNRKSKIINHKSKIILLDAGGTSYTQKTAQRLSTLDHLILICGHYEGVDYRVHEHLADEVISIGDYVLTGGEIPAMVLTDSITRLLPGVLDPEATENESFSYSQKLQNHKITKSIVEYPQYTRPENFRGHKVPDVLLSGNHAEIAKWRHKKAQTRTQNRQP
jgi:tRNA (guanine37-N1)-methyltransferase